MNTLFHNPNCSKSRETLALLRSRGVEPEVRLYLEQPPSVEELRVLIGQLGIEAHALLRATEPEYSTLGLADPAIDEAALLAAMHAHPRLIERPIYIRDSQAVIGRPPERVLDLLD